MDTRKDIVENYSSYLKKEKDEKLSENSKLIKEFTDFCKKKQLLLSSNNFDYIRTIGIVATYPNLVYLLNSKISVDKDELVKFSLLEQEFERKPFASGCFYSNHYIVLAHPYFRRGHYKDNNFSPDFINIFSNYDKANNEKFIAIDSDRVRINVDNSVYMEFDTWYGAKFKHTISDIPDGIVKLRPPLELEPFQVDFLFGNTYSLDIKWSTKDGIKTFQAEEFKEDNARIIKEGVEYYPVKYLHAEFDIRKKTFRHFDGAIHFYSEEEYYCRRDGDFNYNSKNNLQLKTLSQKLFKVNGCVEIADWVNLVSHYLTGNPLVFEYFEGNLPKNVIDMVEIFKTSKKVIE